MKVLEDKEFRSKLKERTIESFKNNGILDIEEIVETYNSYIYTIFKNTIKNELDIEESLSDVFVIFWKNYKNLDENTLVKPYLIGITKNLIRKKYAEYKKAIQNIELYEERLSYNIDIEELAENEEKSNIIKQSLSKMKETEKETFIMFYYKQKKIKEISQILEISESKVKIILHRTRKVIKKKLKERGYDYGK